MNKYYLKSVTLILIFVLVSNSYSQIIEKNGIHYRNFILNEGFNSNTQTSNSLTKYVADNIVDPPIIKNDFMVNTLDGEYGCDQSRGSVAMDGSGNYASAWIDKRNDQKEIFAQFFDYNGNRSGSNFKLNQDLLVGNNAPFIATNKKGDFVVVWLRNFSDVMAQKFNSNGQAIGSNFQVNTTYGQNTAEPSVAVYKDGSFAVMWSAEQGDWNYKVYARLFDSLGNSLGTEIIVNEPTKNISSIGQGKHIAVDDNGNYYISWSSYNKSTFSNIYLQQIDKSGAKVGSNLTINNSNDSSDCYFPEIVSTNDGYLFIVWQKQFRYQIKNGISARICYSTNSFITDEIDISHADVWGDSFSLSTDRDSLFIYSFSGEEPPSFQMLNKSGVFIGDPVKVNYNSSIISYVQTGVLTEIVNNSFLNVAIIYERNDANLYYQKFDKNLIAIGTFEKINDDVGSASQKKPLVKYNNKGESIILWEDKRNGRYDLYAQVYDKDYNLVGENIQVNDAKGDHWYLGDKAVQTLSDGTFIVAFIGSDEYSGYAVWLQKIDCSGQKTGSNVIVKGKTYNYSYKLSMNTNSIDEILVCWYYRYGAYLKRFDKNLSTISGEKNFMSYSNNTAFYPFTISVDTGFNLFSVWQDYDLANYTSGTKIFGKFYNQNGQPTSELILVDSADFNQTEIYCKNNGKDYLVVYFKDSKYHIKRKYFLGNDYYLDDGFYHYDYPPSINIVKFDKRQFLITYNDFSTAMGLYYNDNKHILKTFKLHQYDYVNYFYDDYNGTNSCDIFNKKLLFSFESNKNGATSSDIWANVRNLEEADFSGEYFFTPVASDYLYDNFPNPFNFKTKIHYQLLAYHRVKLAVYDILGKEIKVLVDENQEKGIYEIDFDASGLPSGVYFYRLEAFDTSVKKMILLK